MSKQTGCVWFIEPLDSNTNIAFDQQISDDNFTAGVLCEDGKRHNLWECPFWLLASFQRSSRTMGLQFRIFNRFGNGQIRECEFLYRKRKPQRKTKTAP